MPGELSAKVVAKCFWHHEVEQELTERGLRKEWVFGQQQHDKEHSGTHDNVMEYVDKKRYEELYLHNCPNHCSQKGESSCISEKTYAAVLKRYWIAVIT